MLRLSQRVLKKLGNFPPWMSLYLIEHDYRPQTRRLPLLSTMRDLERLSLVCRSLPSRYGDRRRFQLAHHVDRNAPADGETSSPAFTLYRVPVDAPIICRLSFR